MSAPEFNEILLGNANFLKPFAINLTRDTEAANDLYQETLYKALSNRDKYRSGTNIKAWLFTIMRNIFINSYRRKVKQRKIFDSNAFESADNLRVAVSVDPEAMIRAKEINQAIRKLPEIFKTPFLLHFEGYKYNEIAEVLNEPLGTIKSRIHFARKLLKEQISQY